MPLLKVPLSTRGSASLPLKTDPRHAEAHFNIDPAFANAFFNLATALPVRGDSNT
jgi:hypothetical protein